MTFDINGCFDSAFLRLRGFLRVLFLEPLVDKFAMIQNSFNQSVGILGSQLEL